MAAMRPSVRTYLVDDGGRRVFGPGPAELLRRIRELGSLRAAAQSMGMAYTKALALLRAAESACGFPLTTRVVGGAGGGGSTPTPEADALLARYERWSVDVSSHAVALYEAAAPFAKPARSADGNPSVGVVVLASGRATRFGANKLLEPLTGGTVLEGTLGCVPAGLPVCVVSCWPGVEELCEARCLSHVRPDGPDQGDSVRAGVAFAAANGWDACVFLPGDQPLVGTGSVMGLLAASAAHRDACVRLSWRGRDASPVLFPARAYGALSRVRGDVGGASVLRGEARDLPVVRVEATWPWELWDVDTPGDLARVRQLVEAGFGRGA